jgi:hypothetical protein
MPVLPGEGQGAGCPGAPHLAVSGDPPFNDGIVGLCSTAKICAALLRNGESLRARKCATVLWIDAFGLGSKGKSPRISTSHVRKPGEIAGAVTAAISVIPVTTA